VTASEYRYEIPSTIAAGPTLIEVDNRGRDLHLLVLLHDRDSGAQPLDRAVEFVRNYGHAEPSHRQLAGDPGPRRHQAKRFRTSTA
jgi:hypothetical protein